MIRHIATAEVEKKLFENCKDVKEYIQKDFANITTDMVGVCYANVEEKRGWY